MDYILPAIKVLSIDRAVVDECDDSINYTTEFLNSLNVAGLPPHMLTLKVGAIVILLRNINVKEGLCNGSRLIIKELNVNSVRCSIAVGTHHGL